MPGASSAAPFAGDRRLTLGVAALLILAGAGACAQPETVELVAIHGCGTEQEFSGLRVRVIGDFPASAGTELLLGPGERGQIPALDQDAARGVVVEGLFGTTVTAIGRSYAIDPSLARGRVPGVDGEAEVLPIYFAAPDSACAVDSSLAPRTEVGLAAGPAGDVLIAGGLAADGSIMTELVHVDLFADRVRSLADPLPSPRRGASVHDVGGRRFVVLGGIEPGGAALAERVVVDVGKAGRVFAGEPMRASGQPVALAHHASAIGPSGEVWVAGGCDAADPAGACVPESAHARAYRLDLGPPEPSGAVLPELVVPRYAAELQVSPDGVAFVAGGVGADGLGLASVERLLPGGAWELVHTLADDEPIAGFALLDGGLALLTDEQGAVHWWSEAGSGTLDPTSRAPALEPFAGPRSIVALPGERAFVDGWLFAPATAAIDPAVERRSTAADDRTGAGMLVLADGSVLVVGGSALASPDALASPPLLRLRPQLDGPDEWIPDLAGPATDAFVSCAPGSATVIVGGLQVDGQGPADAIAPVEAHVRGFRSGALRLELEFEVDPGAVAQLVFRQGAVATVAIALAEDGVVVRQRDPDGTVTTLDCAGGAGGVAEGSPIVVVLDEHAGSLALTADGLALACALDWPSDAGASVGFGASGAGSARFYGQRLARR